MAKFKPIKHDEKMVISIRIGEDLLKSVDTLATDNGMSRNEFLLQCISYAIENYANENESE